MNIHTNIHKIFKSAGLSQSALLTEFLMKLDENKKALRKNLYLFTAVALAVIYSLNELVVSPVYTAVISNIMYDGSALIDILYYLRRLLDLVAVAAAYAVMIYGIYRFTLSDFKGSVGIFIGATLYKYALSVIVGWFNNGSVPTTWPIDVFNLLLNSALEILQLVIVLAIVSGMISRHWRAVEYCKKIAREDIIPEILPLKKLYGKENCLLRSVLASSLVILFRLLITQAVNDILTIEKITDPWLMIVAYLASVVLGVICYFVMYVTLNFCSDKLENACNKRENPAAE